MGLFMDTRASQNDFDKKEEINSFLRRISRKIAKEYVRVSVGGQWVIIAPKTRRVTSLVFAADKSQASF